MRRSGAGRGAGDCRLSQAHWRIRKGPAHHPSAVGALLGASDAVAEPSPSPGPEPALIQALTSYERGDYADVIARLLPPSPRGGETPAGWNC